MSTKRLLEELRLKKQYIDSAIRALEQLQQLEASAEPSRGRSVIEFRPASRCDAGDPSVT